MSRFQGGPAEGIDLALHRGPRYLRVVESPAGFDALDQLEDTPADGEVVWVYRMEGQPRVAHLNYGGRRTSGPQSGWYDFSDYVYVEVDEKTRDQLRETEAWRAWVMEQP